MVASSKTNNYLTNISGASKVALGGFDPVAFFKVSKPINGNFKMTAEHKGGEIDIASLASSIHLSSDG